MATTLTSKGQVTIPKRIRDALGLKPGQRVEFSVGDNGTVVIHRAQTGKPRPGTKDRFAASRGIAQTDWRTDQLMALLRD
jgi:AbrB family looped-hinge helix DNA binding protein